MEGVGTSAAKESVCDSNTPKKPSRRILFRRFMDPFPIPSFFRPFPKKTRSPRTGDENHDIRTATNRIDRFPTERKALDKRKVFSRKRSSVSSRKTHDEIRDECEDDKSDAHTKQIRSQRRIDSFSLVRAGGAAKQKQACRKRRQACSVQKSDFPNRWERGYGTQLRALFSASTTRSG